MSLGCFKNCHDKICFLLDFIEFAESCALVYWACAFSLLFVNQWRLSNSVTGTNRDNSVILITSLWVNRLLKIIKLIAPVIILFPGKNVCSPCKTVIWYPKTPYNRSERGSTWSSLVTINDGVLVMNWFDFYWWAIPYHSPAILNFVYNN